MTLITAVTNDIYQIQIPLPFALRIVNCYLLAGHNGWTIVDTGLNTSRARAAWLEAFSALGIRPGTTEQIVLTHAHPDHYGLAGWLIDSCVDDGGPPPPVYMSAREAELADHVWKAGLLLQEPFIAHWHKCALPEGLIQEIVDSTQHTRERTFPHPHQHNLIQTDAKIRLGNRLMQPILTPGHSDGHLIFYDEAENLLLCGDHVLLKITPNISLWPHGDPNPLRTYLGSLIELNNLDVKLALPGHGPLIEDFHGRIAEISHHHHLRLEETLKALTEPATVYEVSQRLFAHENLSIHEMRFAAAESLAHLDFLVKDGRVQQQGDTIWRFSRI